MTTITIIVGLTVVIVASLIRDGIVRVAERNNPDTYSNTRDIIEAIDGLNCMSDYDKTEAIKEIINKIDKVHPEEEVLSSKNSEE